jgi:hypothetical protein
MSIFISFISLSACRRQAGMLCGELSCIVKSSLPPPRSRFFPVEPQALRFQNLLVITVVGLSLVRVALLQSFCYPLTDRLIPSREMLLLLVLPPLTVMLALPRPLVRTSVRSPAVPEDSESRNRGFGEASGRRASIAASIDWPMTGLTGLISDARPPRPQLFP